MNTYTTKIEIGFGVGFRKDGSKISPEELQHKLKMVEGAALRRFGGCTLIPTEGAWVSPTGTLFREGGRTLVVYANGSCMARELATVVRDLLQQEAVFLCVSKISAELI